MTSILTGLDGAATALSAIAETSSGERRFRATTAALVLRAVERRLLDGHGCGFLTARAEAELRRLPRGTERAVLRRLLSDVEQSDAGDLVVHLVDYACTLESTKRLPEADAVLELARAAQPDDAEVALHAGRIARKMGARERALELYARARELDGRTGVVGRLAEMGEAVVSDEPVPALGRLIREAVRAGDLESAGVGLEERARARRAAGDRRGAARDLCVAAWRYPDATDRARVAHELADLAVAMGDSLAAREALLLAISFGSSPQRDHARARLHMLARALGDEVGARRWRSSGRPSLVSLTLARARQTETTAAPLLARWRESMEASLAASPA